MNPTDFIAFFINVLVACNAMPAYETVLSGEHFLVQTWSCDTKDKPVTIKAYTPECDTGHTKYWGRHIFVEWQEWQTAQYLTRFGEVQIGQGAQLADAYKPACGG